MAEKSRKVQYSPVRGFILVKPLQESAAKGWDAHTDDDIPHYAEVLAVGENTYFEHTGLLFKAPCKVGDTIIHSSIGFENIKIDGEEYRLVPFGKVLMVKK